MKNLPFRVLPEKTIHFLLVPEDVSIALDLVGTSRVRWALCCSIRRGLHHDGPPLYSTTYRRVASQLHAYCCGSS